jgi:hypothetical protein
MLAGCGIVLVGAVLFQLREPKEPEYGGRKLSEWAWLLYENQGGSIDSMASGPGGAAALEAIRSIGANGVPFAIRWIHYRPQPWRDWAGRLPKITYPFLRRTVWRADRLSVAAPVMLAALGPSADVAAPDLARAGMDPRRHDNGECFRALTCVGERGRQEIATALKTTRGREAAQVVGPVLDAAALGTNVSSLMPALLIYRSRCGQDEGYLRHNSWEVLKDSRLQAALGHCLQDPNATVSLQAVELISSIAPRCPELSNRVVISLSDPEPAVRREATNAVRGYER